MLSPSTADLIKCSIAIISLTTLEAIALNKGKNGTMLRIVIIAIAGIAGFSLAQLIR